MQCEMCGKATELFLTELEGVELTVCTACGKHGKIIKKVKSEEDVKKDEKKESRRVKRILAAPQKEIIQTIKTDYAQLVRQARERKGLTQREFAKQLKERESVIHNLETGRYEPSISLAEKLEKFLSIQLIEDYEDVSVAGTPSTSESLTIGDMIKIKKR